MKGRILAIVALLLAARATPAESEGRYLVRVHCEGEAVAAFSERMGVRAAYPSEAVPGAFFVTVSDLWSERQALELLRSDACVADVEADERVRLFEVDDDDDDDQWQRGASASSNLGGRGRVRFFGDLVDANYIDQPAARIIRIDWAHRAYATGAGVVAVIDTGIDPTHPVLREALVPGYDFVRDESGWASEWKDLDAATAAALSDPDVSGVDQSSVGVLNQSSVAVLNQSSVAVLNQSTVAVLNDVVAHRLRAPEYAAFGHGTMVAGLIHRVAPTAKIMPLKVFRSDGSARSGDIVRAIYFAVEHGADVINMSFSFSHFSAELMRAIGRPIEVEPTPDAKDE